MGWFKKKKHKTPYGIRALSSFVYAGIVGILLILWIVLSPSVPSFLSAFQLAFKSASFVTPLNLFISIITLISMVIILIGFNKRKLFYWKFTLIWLAIVSISNLIDLIMMFWKQSTFFLILCQLLIFLLGSYFAFYIYRRKDFYEMKSLPADFPMDKNEKNLKKAIWIFVILFIISLQGQSLTDLYLLINFLRTLGETRFDTQEAIPLCEQQKGIFKDACLYNLIEVNRVDRFGYNSNFSLTDEYCEKINNTRYHDKCEILFRNCNKIRRESDRRICYIVLQSLDMGFTNFTAFINGDYLFSKEDITHVCKPSECYYPPLYSWESNLYEWETSYYLDINISEDAYKRYLTSISKLSSYEDDAYKRYNGSILFYIDGEYAGKSNIIFARNVKPDNRITVTIFVHADAGKEVIEKAYSQRDYLQEFLSSK